MQKNVSTEFPLTEQPLQYLCSSETNVEMQIRLCWTLDQKKPKKPTERTNGKEDDNCNTHMSKKRQTKISWRITRSSQTNISIKAYTEHPTEALKAQIAHKQTQTAPRCARPQHEAPWACKHSYDNHKHRLRQKDNRGRPKP